jgi:hypothetical protein
MLFPNLVSIQANFMVENNPQLLGIIDMPELSNVGGNIDLTGTFNSVDLPALTKIGGGVNIQSTSGTFQCPSNIHGSETGSSFICEGNVADPTPAQGLQYAATSSPSSSSHKSNGVKTESSK